MKLSSFGQVTCLISSCVLGGLAGSATLQTGAANPRASAELALKQLQEDFHGANTTGDYALMHSLWAHDAVWSNPAVTLNGPDEIADFFAGGAGWGNYASLTPSYKAISLLGPNTAVFAFECVIVDMDGLDPLATPLSSLPPGSQNPNVEIIQHSTATCTAVRRGNRWLFQSFDGAGGVIQP